MVSDFRCAVSGAIHSLRLVRWMVLLDSARRFDYFWGATPVFLSELSPQFSSHLFKLGSNMSARRRCNSDVGPSRVSRSTVSVWRGTRLPMPRTATHKFAVEESVGPS